jgi:hypothetical protein
MLKPISISALPARRRGGLSLAALLAGLALSASCALAEGREAPPTPAALAGSTVPPDLQAVPPLAAPAAERVNAAAPRAAAEQASVDERQRRLLMLLLMNSAGSLHPYGGLTR